MTLKTRRWTRADLDRLPDDDNKYEVVHGELFVTPPPSVGHEEVRRILSDHLKDIVQENGLGWVYSGESGFAVGKSQVIPDILVRRRVPRPLPEDWAEMPDPDLVVEISSKSTRLRDLVAKRSFYLEAGIEYWIVDRDSRAIRVLAPGGQDDVHTYSFAWQPRGAAQTFTVDVAAIFKPDAKVVIATDRHVGRNAD